MRQGRLDDQANFGDLDIYPGVDRGHLPQLGDECLLEVAQLCIVTAELACQPGWWPGWNDRRRP